MYIISLRDNLYVNIEADIKIPFLFEIICKSLFFSIEMPWFQLCFYGFESIIQEDSDFYIKHTVIVH